ncbi:MAG TPA: hypothetical protein VM639_11355 [Dongiaceae bacterium]|nr:hypothetical protein [Dongiaceae bacterium]
MILTQRLRQGLSWRRDLAVHEFQRLVSHGRDAYLRGLVAWRWRSRRQNAALGRPSHGLPAPLILSLTSFPARYGTLALTLKCLLLQSVRPDRVILWIAKEHQDRLTPEILALRDEGLEIGDCDNSLRSHNKYLHSRRLYPDAFIATADDDTYYWPDWLAELIADHDPRRKVIPCHRVHRIKLGPDSRPAAYRDWEWESTALEADALVFPTGVGGVLYRPDCLHRDVDDAARILALCPRADDIWLYWMAQRQGFLFRRTALGRPLHHWRTSQAEGLMWSNVFEANGNDEQMSAMIDAFGWPAYHPPQ